MASKAKTRALVPITARANSHPGSLLAVHEGTRLLPVERPDSASQDGYLRMTAHILLQSQRRDFRTVGVISAKTGEGKTTAAVNLASCLGRTRGRSGRVLLVDGDARKRTLTSLLCPPSDPIHNRPDTRHPMLVATAFEGVDLMTAPEGGQGALNDPAAWAQTLHELRSRYAQIVIDCPAILDDPEGMVLRDCVEELVLVVSAGKTPRKTLQRALGNMSKRVVGVILNGASPERA